MKDSWVWQPASFGARAGVFGKCAEAVVEHIAENFVTDFEFRDVLANCFNDSGDVAAEDVKLRFGFGQTQHEAHGKRISTRQVPVSGVHRCGVNLD